MFKAIELDLHTHTIASGHAYGTGFQVPVRI